MKELLFKRKSRFALYILACFIPVLDNFLVNVSLSIIIGSIQRGDLDYFLRVCLLALAVVVLGSLLYILSRFMRISFMRDILLDVRVLAFDKILSSSYVSFNKKSKDTYISNLINDINIFENNFFIQLINLIFKGGVYTVSLAVICFLDLKYALMAFFTSMLLFIVSRSFEKRTIKLQEEVSDQSEKFSVSMSNTFNGLEIVKLNNIEDEFLAKSLKSILGLEKKKFGYNIYTDAQKRVMEFLAFAFIAGSLVYFSSLMAQGVSLTRLTLMLQFSNGIIWNITSALPLFNQFRSSTKIFEKITQKENDPAFDSKKGKDKDFQFNAEIAVENLSFGYDQKEVFEDVVLRIEKGKKYLIKGGSGVGKSTLIKLLSMIYDDYSGRITMDGVDYKEIRESSFNQYVSFVYQEVFLFEDTIYNNIALYKDYGDEKVLEAAKKAGLEELLAKKADGIQEMLLDSGKNLSGGERQRISIARAIIKDTEILFVDEATSGLDEELGRRVEETILSQDCTVIAVSHRYFAGITEQYDYVLEIKGGTISQYRATDYFTEVAV